MNARKIGLIATTLLLMAYAIVGVTFALWSIDENFSESVQSESYASFGIARDNGSLTDSDYQWFQDSGTSMQIVFDEGDAADAAAAGASGIATPIYMKARAEGNNGLQYSVQINPFSSSPPSNTFFEAATVRLFPVASAAECTVANAPTTQDPNPFSIDAILPSDTFDQKTDVWCVTIVDNGTSGTRTNTGHVEGTGAGQTVEDDDTFTANIVEDLVIHFEHSITRP